MILVEYTKIVHTASGETKEKFIRKIFSDNNMEELNSYLESLEDRKAVAIKQISSEEEKK